MSKQERDEVKMQLHRLFKNAVDSDVWGQSIEASQFYKRYCCDDDKLVE